MSQNIPFQFGGSGGQHPSQQPQSTPSIPQSQPNGQPAAMAPAVPGNLADALKGIPPEQLMQIVQMVKAGLLAPPQAPPAAQHQAPPLPMTTNQPAAPPAAAQGSIASARQEDVDMDKEEGELEEGEEPETGRERGFLRPPPTGPRKRSVTPRDRYGRAQSDRRASLQDPNTSPTSAHARKSSNQIHAAQLGRQGSSPSSVSKKPAVNGQHSGRRRIDTGSAARAFVLQMHKAGYTFDQLAREIPNTKALRRMYKALGLSIPAEKPMPHINGTGAPPTQSAQQLDGASVYSPQQPVATDERKVFVTKRPLPAKPAGAVDRAEYLAKLAAARTSKAKPAVPDTPVVKPEEGPQTALTPSQTAAQPTTPSTATQPSNQPPAARAMVKTELVKQRLEKLRAEQAAKASAAQQSSDLPVASSPVSKPTAATTSSMQQPTTAHVPTNGLGAGLTDVASLAPPVPQPTQAPAQPPAQPIYAPPPPLQTTFSPTPPTPGRSFSALPGLFMASTPIQPSPSSQAPPAVPSPATASRPLPPTFSAQQQNASVASNKTLAPSPAASPAPLNISRKRSVVAEFDTDIPQNVARVPKRPLFGQSRSNSESERFIIPVSDDEEDEDEMDAEPTPVQSTATRNIGVLPGFPPRPNFASGFSTPPVSTPRDQEEQQKKAIAELKRRIAVKEAAQKEAKARAKANGKQLASAATSGNSTPVPQMAASLTVDTVVATESPKPASPQVTSTASSTVTEKPLSAAAVLRQQEKARLEQRLRELHADPHFANGNGAVATLMAPTQAASEPAVSGAMLNDGRAANEVNTVQVRQAPAEMKNVVVAAGEGAQQASSEEAGEVGEDAEPLPGAGEQMAMSLDIPVDDGKIGSQATTASGTSQPDAEGDLTVTAPEQPQEQIDDALSVVEEVMKDAAEPDDNTIDDVQEMEVDGGSSEDEDDESDTSDLDGPGSATKGLTNEQSAAQEVASVDDDSSSASSDDSEDFEPEPAEHRALQAQVGDDAEDVDEDDEYEPEPVIGTSRSAETGAAKQSATVTISDVNQADTAMTEAGKPSINDDLAPELQPQKSQQTAIHDEDHKPHLSHYRPYESVLALFNDYRYHPEYLDNVSGGYRSLTYSHNIDPIKPLCMFEAAGGQCNDRSCDNQHFRTMALSDTDLLKELGTHRTPVDNPEARQKWNAGLSAVVKHLRTTNQGRDANAIATRIAEYRREFVGDPTKILNLG